MLRSNSFDIMNSFIHRLCNMIHTTQYLQIMNPCSNLTALNAPYPLTETMTP